MPITSERIWEWRRDIVTILICTVTRIFQLFVNMLKPSKLIGICATRYSDNINMYCDVSIDLWIIIHWFFNAIYSDWCCFLCLVYV